MLQSILVQRAIAAYASEAARHGALPHEPAATSAVELLAGRRYVVLRTLTCSVERTLVVYRVNGGALRREIQVPSPLLA